MNSFFFSDFLPVQIKEVAEYVLSGTVNMFPSLSTLDTNEINVVVFLIPHVDGSYHPAILGNMGQDSDSIKDSIHGVQKETFFECFVGVFLERNSSDQLCMVLIVRANTESVSYEKFEIAGEEGDYSIVLSSRQPLVDLDVLHRVQSYFLRHVTM